MRHRTTAFFMASTLLFGGTALGAESYAIDPAHTSVGFSVRHMLVSNVRGVFTDLSGTLLYDAAAPAKSSAEVTIQVSSINTNNVNRDKDLRSPAFFDVDKYPTITFKSTKVEKKGDSYLCTGNLTMHGVTREVAIPFEIVGTVKDPSGRTRMGVEGSLALNRQDYGLNWNKTMDNGGLVVGNEVKITLSVESILQ